MSAQERGLIQPGKFSDDPQQRYVLLPSRYAPEVRRWQRRSSQAAPESAAVVPEIQWISYGENPGLKSADLAAFALRGLPGLAIPDSISIGASLFSEAHQAGWPNDSEAPIPDALRETIKDVAQRVTPLQPLAVRSSATDEHGGSGIYRTKFIIPLGSFDVTGNSLTFAIQDIYRRWYTIHGDEQPTAAQGMGVLIQPVVGDRYDHDRFYAPIISGVIAAESEGAQIRLCVGLPTAAVDARSYSMSLPAHGIDLKKALRRLKTMKSMDVLGYGRADPRTMEIPPLIRQRIPLQEEKLRRVIEAYHQLAQAGEPQYLEFAISERDPFPAIVQASAEIPPTVALQELPPVEGTVVLHATDVYHTGVRKGRGVIMARTPFPDQLDTIQRLNKQMHNHLLVVPDVWLSSLQYGRGLGAEHFSRAGGVVELQLERSGGIDHRGGRGASHFAGLCRQRNILFIGAPESSFYISALGVPTMSFPDGLTYYDVPYRMANTPREGRLELFAPSELFPGNRNNE